jgi:hypothetical protein
MPIRRHAETNIPTRPFSFHMISTLWGPLPPDATSREW